MTWRIVISLVVAAIVIVFLSFQVLPASSHSFFDQWCCSDRDCTTAPAGAVKWTPDGWAISTPTIQTTVPFDSDRIRHNPPNEPQFRICEYPKNELRCLYLPETDG